MPTQLSHKQIEEILIQLFPQFLKKNKEFQQYIIDIARGEYADKETTEDRIDRILDELKRDREKSEKRWRAWEKKWEEAHKKDAAKWEAQEQKWAKHFEEDRIKWEAQEQKWAKHFEEDRIRWEAQEQKWAKHFEEDRIRWEAQEQKWRENQKVINDLLLEVKKLGRKHDSTIGALGARWGVQTEKAFRDALRSILEESFNVKVEHYIDYDEEGIVFDEPDQVELDVIVHNGLLILCEIKASMSQSEMHTFWRKKKYYEKKHSTKVDRMIVISPMVNPRAMQTAKKLGIEVFGYAEDVTI